jgi:arginine repressor
MAATPTPEVNKSQSIRDFFKQNPTAHAKEVVTGLAAKGITVTESHVYVVKGKMKLKRLRKGKEKAAASEDGAAKTMPDVPNKSQAVRAFLSENPKATVEEVINTFAAKGINVKKGVVYFVKNQLKSKKRRQAKEKVAQEMTQTAAASPSSDGDVLKTIKLIKSLAAELGGMKKLKALVDALTE